MGAALVGCHHSPAASERPRAPAPLPAANSNQVVFFGACDASGAVPLSPGSFVVADDEDNVLRVYDARRGGAPSSSLELSSALGLPMKRKKSGSAEQFPDADIEAATSIGDRAYFLTSHGRNAAGKLKPERFRFFATELRDGRAEPIGRPYERLLDDLLAEPRLAAADLRRAASLAPKEPGGFNLEGMTARHEGGVWIGFRNPIPKGRALLIPLLNPEELITGNSARFGDPVTLDLGGLGVRGLTYWHGRYIIAAGPFDHGRSSRLFTWDGRDRVEPVPGVNLDDFNPEAFFSPEENPRMMLLSDDGSRSLDGEECKRLRDPARRHFRGRWLDLP
jgi:hypothetical protein